MTDTLQQLDEVTAMIAEAREAVVAGEIIDLSEIQARVQNICLEIQETPPDESSTVESKIVAIVANLNSLAEDLKSQQQGLGADVIHSAVRNAYKMPKDDR